MSYPAYPEYKDSGVEWLGEVPAHWEVTALKRGHDVVLGKMLQPEPKQESDQLLPYLRAANIQPTGVDLKDVRKMWFSPSEARQLALEYGDLLISEGGDVGRPALWSNGSGYHIQNSINRVRPNANNCSSFLFYWMLAIKQKGYVDVLCNKSTIAHFTAEKVASVPTPFPPGSEQTQIATFLDHETVRIDALVEEQQRLIALLKEKHQAVISHAVTKGLDPEVPMKDSGVEWLGEVPEHWKIKRVKHLCALGSDSLRPGPFGSHIKGDDFIEESSFRVYNQATVISDDFSKSAYIDESKYRELKAFSVRPKDMLLTSRGTIGKVSIVPESIDRGVIHPCLIRLRLDKNHVYLPYFKFFFGDTDIAVEQLRLASNSTTIDVVYAENLANLWIAIPPVEEQERIAVKIGPQLRVINSIICAATQQVSLLKERRSALISAAVTGKIDVRGWQPPEGADAKEASQQEAV